MLEVIRTQWERAVKSYLILLDTRDTLLIDQKYPASFFLTYNITSFLESWLLFIYLGLEDDLRHIFDFTTLWSLLCTFENINEHNFVRTLKRLNVLNLPNIFLSFYPDPVTDRPEYLRIYSDLVDVYGTTELRSRLSNKF